MTASLRQGGLTNFCIHWQLKSVGKSTPHSQAGKPALRLCLSWPKGGVITSLTFGCHLNVAVGPAIIPFTVLDSGMLRSYRGKDRWSQHCGASGAGVFLAQLGAPLHCFAFFSHTPPQTTLASLKVSPGTALMTGETGQVLVNTEGSLLFSGPE